MDAELGINHTYLFCEFHYADITGEAISAQLRGLRLRSVDVKRSGSTRKGVRADDIDTALRARSTL